MHFLIVEDTEKIKEFLKDGLTKAGYQVDCTEMGQIALEMCAKTTYDLVILDVGLPDQSGLEVSRQLRHKGYNAPILMLTAYNSTTDKVSGLDSGADDYLTKPFELDELLARVRALLRRPRASDKAQTVLQYKDIEMDLIQRKVMRKGQPVTLTTKEFSLLEYFMRHPEKPLTRAEISEKVWDLTLDTESNVIDVYVNFLRKKIDQPFGSRMIQTVVGVGYVLKEPKQTTPTGGPAGAPNLQ